MALVSGSVEVARTGATVVENGECVQKFLQRSMGSPNTYELVRQRNCNHAYAAPCLQRLLPRMVMRLGCIAALLEKAFGLLGTNSHRRIPDRSQSRPKRHVKQQPNCLTGGEA